MTAQLLQPGIRKGRRLPLTRGLGYPQIPILYTNETLYGTLEAMQSGRGDAYWRPCCLIINAALL